MTGSIIIYKKDEIQAIRHVGYLASKLLDYITPFVKAGMSTKHLDDLMREYTVKVLGARSACLHYKPAGMTPYTAATCISVNHVICHGIPSEKKLLKNGDIVNIDVTLEKDGFYGDNSRMFQVGKPTIAGNRLVEATFGCMWAGIEAVRPGGNFNDIGQACYDFVTPMGLTIVREYGGHGIGREFHGEPHVSHFPLSAPTADFEPGMIFTVEPMVNAGKRFISTLGNGWTVVTKDQSLSAQWELQVLVTDTGYDILTVSEGSRTPPSWVKGWKKPTSFS